MSYFSPTIFMLENDEDPFFMIVSPKRQVIMQRGASFQAARRNSRARRRRGQVWDRYPIYMPELGTVRGMLAREYGTG
jgi:hypothetical protein